MTGLLHLIHDPVPIPDCLHRDAAAGPQTSQKCPIRFSIMIHSHRGFCLSCLIHGDKQRRFLVRITTDKMSHAATPPMVLSDLWGMAPTISVAALSSNQAGSSGM